MTLDDKLAKLGLKRFGNFGKKIGNNIYIHCSYVGRVQGLARNIEKKRLKYLRSVNSYVIRYDAKTYEACLAFCPGFCDESEPEIWFTWNLTTGKFIKYSNNNRPIYHHKWMMVADNFKGFDVKESKRRSVTWKKKVGTNKFVSSRIGRKKYWDKMCRDLGIK